MQEEPEQLVKQFAGARQKQDACIRAGNSCKGNQYAQMASEAARVLLSSGDKSIDLFANLLEHDDHSVRVLAAAFLLRDRTEKAVNTLKSLVEEKGLAALGAKMTLERYKNGDLDIQ